jgi:ribonuclease HII
MHDVISKLSIQPEKILVDGNYFRTYWDNTGTEIEHECIIEGDNKYMSIAAASILAKTYKDKYIEDIVNKYPELNKYDLLNNSGYGTQNHIEGIKMYGLSEYHRKTFGICKNY